MQLGKWKHKYMYFRNYWFISIYYIPISNICLLSLAPGLCGSGDPSDYVSIVAVSKMLAALCWCWDQADPPPEMELFMSNPEQSGAKQWAVSSHRTSHSHNPLVTPSSPHQLLAGNIKIVFFFEIVIMGRRDGIRI